MKIIIFFCFHLFLNNLPTILTMFCLLFHPKKKKGLYDIDKNNLLLKLKVLFPKPESVPISLQ